MNVSTSWPEIVGALVIVFIAGAFCCRVLGPPKSEAQVIDLRPDLADWLFARVLERLGLARHEIDKPVNVSDTQLLNEEMLANLKAAKQQLDIAIGFCACYARGKIERDPTKADDDVDRWQVAE